jgi:PAS domain-containing protein
VILKLSNKVKLLIAVPLICELAFVAILVHTLKQIETEYAREALARQVSYSTNAILKNLLDASAAYGMYQIDKDKRFMAQFSDAVTSLKKEKQRLTRLVASTQPPELVAFDKVTDEVVASLDNALQLLKTGDRVDLVRSLIRVRRLLKDVNQAGSGVIGQQMVLDEFHRKASARIRENIEITIIVGVFLSVCLAVAMTVYYDATTQRRFNVLLRNTKLLSREEPLEAQLDGQDELSELDKSFHYMVRMVSEARRKEQALTENAADVICSLDREGRFTKINAACEQVWGIKPAEY